MVDAWLLFGGLKRLQKTILRFIIDQIKSTGDVGQAIMSQPLLGNQMSLMKSSVLREAKNL
jgi:hypothetical protein